MLEKKIFNWEKCFNQSIIVREKVIIHSISAFFHHIQKRRGYWLFGWLNWKIQWQKNDPTDMHTIVYYLYKYTLFSSLLDNIKWSLYYIARTRIVPHSLVGSSRQHLLIGSHYHLSPFVYSVKSWITLREVPHFSQPVGRLPLTEHRETLILWKDIL